MDSPDSISLTAREQAVLQEIRQCVAAGPVYGPCQLMLLVGNDPDTFTAVICKITAVYDGVLKQIGVNLFGGDSNG